MVTAEGRIEVYSQGELVDALYGMIRKSPKSKYWWSWYKPDENLWTNRHEQVRLLFNTFVNGRFKPDSNEYTSNHKQIEFKGETLDVKLPMFWGWLLIHKLRPVGERYFNDSFTVGEKWSEAVERETQVLKKLNKSAYPTLECRQDNIRDSQYLEDKLLLTSYVPNASNVVQLLNTETRPRKLELLEEASGLLHRLHKHEDTAWGDPWFGNVMLDGNEMLLHDFGFYPSNIHDKKYLFARDLLGLAVSGKFRSGLDAEEVVEVMLRHYRIDTDMKNAINHAIEYDEKQYRNPAMRLIKSYIFNNFVFGMTEKEVMPVKREVLAQL